MKKIEQAGSDANQVPGKTSYTGTSVLSRTAKNTPANEPAIRGLEVTEKVMESVHQNSAPAITYWCLREALLETGRIEIIEEV